MSICADFHFRAQSLFRVLDVFITARNEVGARLFLHVSVILFTPLGRHPLWIDTPCADTPWADTPGRHPPGNTPRANTPRSVCWDTVNKRAVRILLECNLVSDNITRFVTNMSITYYHPPTVASGRKCFHRRLSVILFTGGVGMVSIHIHILSNLIFDLIFSHIDQFLR